VITPTVIKTSRAGQTNARVELAHYTISEGERVIYGQRVLGVVRLVDETATGEGRRYVIERELTIMAELEAIVADYLLCRRRQNRYCADLWVMPNRGLNCPEIAGSVAAGVGIFR
jgi:hypothetical protein